jgi:hypothetical protein
VLDLRHDRALFKLGRLRRVLEVALGPTLRRPAAGDGGGRRRPLPDEKAKNMSEWTREEFLDLAKAHETAARVVLTYESGLSEGGWQLVVSFPDQSPSFAHGVEAGKLWARLGNGTQATVEEATMACIKVHQNRTSRQACKSARPAHSCTMTQDVGLCV